MPHPRRVGLLEDTDDAGIELDFANLVPHGLLEGLGDTRQFEEADLVFLHELPHRHLAHTVRIGNRLETILRRQAIDDGQRHCHGVG